MSSTVPFKGVGQSEMSHGVWATTLGDQAPLFHRAMNYRVGIFVDRRRGRPRSLVVLRFVAARNDPAVERGPGNKFHRGVGRMCEQAAQCSSVMLRRTNLMLNR